MAEPAQLPRSVMRYLGEDAPSWWERALDLWFAPKRWESPARYERLGVLLIKRYVPTGGDLVRRRYGVRITEIHGTLDSLIRFECLTRRLEAIHEVTFLGFVGFSLWRARMGYTTLVDLAIAVGVYLVLILSPALLQRYHRLRVYPLVQRLVAAQLRRTREDRDRASAKLGTVGTGLRMDRMGTTGVCVADERDAGPPGRDRAGYRV